MDLISFLLFIYYLCSSCTYIFVNCDVNLHSDKLVIRFHPKNDTQVDLLATRLPIIAKGQVDFWTPPNYVNLPVEVMIPKSVFPQVQAFSQSNGFVDTKVVVEDVEMLLKASTNFEATRHPRSFIKIPLKEFFLQYLTLSSINQFMHQLAEMYPNMVTVESIGKSFEGRDIKMMRISKDIAKSSKTIIWLDAAIHAREWLTPSTVLYLAYLLVTRYESDKEITSIVGAFEFVILPCANPDGYEYSHKVDRFWRKTRSKHANSSCIGVDGNRNFGFKWGYSEGDAQINRGPCPEVDNGPHPFSEPETRAISSFLTSVKERVTAYVTVHAQAQMWMYPWGYTREKTKNDKEFAAKVKNITHAIQSKYGRVFKYGASSSVIYPTSGCSHDWAHGELGVPYAYAVELRQNQHCNSQVMCNVFSPPEEEIIASGIEFSAGMITLATDLLSQAARSTSSGSALLESIFLPMLFNGSAALLSFLGDLTHI